MFPMDSLTRWDSQGITDSPNESSSNHHSVQTEVRCVLCRRVFTEDSDTFEGYETLSLCNDCKIVFLESIHPDVRHSHRRRNYRRRVRNRRSSGSVEEIFSHQFLQLINQMRQNPSYMSVSGSEHGQPRDNDIAGMVSPDGSPYTVRGRLRRRRRAHLDNDSDVDSFIGESDTNASVSGYGAFLADSDAISFSGYGLNSDASLDGQSLADREMFMQWNNESHVGSDTDIDPMHAGISHWNSDDDGEEDDEDGEWEEADAEEAVEESNNRHGGVRSTGEGSELSDQEQVRHSPGSRRGDSWRRDDSARNLSLYRHAYMSDLFVDLRTEVQPFVGNSGDYLDERGFEELLIQLAETNSLTRGPPPAAGSVVSSLPRVIISEVHEEHGIVICAVCKDSLIVGTEATQLPCSHLYHASCILPWLSARNSCPICRYELLTDDRDYEEGKRNTSRREAVNELHQTESSGHSSSDTSDDDLDERSSNSQWLLRIGGLQLIENEDEQIEDEIMDHNPNQTNSNDETCVSDHTSTGGRSRGGWFLFAAAPIVSIMGMVLVLWFGNPLIEGRLNRSIRQHDQQQLNGSSGGSTGLLDGGIRSRSWWPFF